MKYCIYFEPRVCDEIELSDESEIGLIDIYDDEQNLVEEGSFIYKGVVVRSDKKGGYSDGYHDYHILKNTPKGCELEGIGVWKDLLEFKTKKEAVNWIKKIPSISYKDYEKLTNESEFKESDESNIKIEENKNNKLSKEDIDGYNTFHTIIRKIIWGEDGYTIRFNPGPGFTGPTSSYTSFKESRLPPMLSNYRNIYKKINKKFPPNDLEKIIEDYKKFPKPPISGGDYPIPSSIINSKTLQNYTEHLKSFTLWKRNIDDFESIKNEITVDGVPKEVKNRKEYEVLRDEKWREHQQKEEDKKYRKRFLKITVISLLLSILLFFLIKSIIIWIVIVSIIILFLRFIRPSLPIFSSPITRKW